MSLGLFQVGCCDFLRPSRAGLAPGWTWKGFLLLFSCPHHFTCSIDCILRRYAATSSRGPWRLFDQISLEGDKKALAACLLLSRVEVCPSEGSRKHRHEGNLLMTLFQKKPNKPLSENKKLHNGSNAYLDLLAEAKSCFLNTVGSLVITWCFWRLVPSCCPQLTAWPHLDKLAGGDSRFCGSVPSCRLICSGGSSEPPLLAAASLSLPRL